ncbi:MAG TPA: TIM barrel protein [Planctomycetota bacterium]|nr:TIM barrel protein [Planctomycetota bacterium]
MAPRIIFGVNLNFTKYVYGRKRAIEVARRKLGVHHVEMVADNDFGPIFYQRSPEAYRLHHWQVADHARAQGVAIPSVFTVYRDTGAIAHSNPEVRESAYHVGLSIIEQAACYGSSYVGLSLFTMSREEAEDPERFQSGFFASLEIWKRWMTDARRLGLKKLLVEMAAAYREGCSTIEETRATLGILDEHHQANPGNTAPVGLCYDTGHGISAAENRDDANRDFRAWFSAFPDRIIEVHLKDTDPNFLETWHFQPGHGIIDSFEVLKAVRDTLTTPEVLVNLEIPGKRGREIGERRALEEHLESIRLVREALGKLGYTEDPSDFGWRHAGQ